MKRNITLWAVIVALTMLVGVVPALAKSGQKITFAVFSDPHLYHSSLGTEGAAFQDYLVQDRKLIRESVAILDAAIEAIIKEGKVKFVLVPGDLTKDGERFNHLLFAQKIEKLKKAGIQVYVVPGNHDINNPHAYRYVKDEEIPIPNVSPQMFKWIYRDGGYRQALFQDPHSLSYVVEPVKGMWLIAMDTCIYDNNRVEGKPTTAGRFTPQTLDWVQKMSRIGTAKGKQVIGMMHHGILEHYSGQSILFPEYVVENWATVSQQLAEAGLQVVFTGHYHANDVTQRSFEGGNSLFDIETGSLVTYPCPYRIVTLNNGRLEVESRFIAEIDYDTGKDSFSDYAENYLTEGLNGIVYFMLMTQYSQPAGEPTLTYASRLAEAFKAHYAGDEEATPETLSIIGGYLYNLQSPIEPMVGQYMATLWTDLNPADTSLSIDLTTGTLSE
jgi:hypothetical protein